MSPQSSGTEQRTGHSGGCRQQLWPPSGGIAKTAKLASRCSHSCGHHQEVVNRGQTIRTAAQATVATIESCLQGQSAQVAADSNCGQHHEVFSRGRSSKRRQQATLATMGVIEQRSQHSAGRSQQLWPPSCCVGQRAERKRAEQLSAPAGGSQQRAQLSTGHSQQLRPPSRGVGRSI